MCGHTSNLRHQPGHLCSKEIRTSWRKFRRNPRQITRLKGQTHEKKCKDVGTETLARKRFIQDMTQTFKVVKGTEAESKQIGTGQI
jgi:hypothetical protein